MMARHTSFRIGGPARIFCEPEGGEELAAALKHFGKAGERVYILGAGSNLLVRDEGVAGAVISLREGAEFRDVRIYGGYVRTGGGVALPKVVGMAARAGLSGLEALVGIPGTMGGAARMNAGGRHGNIGPLVQSALVMRPDGVSVERLPRERLVFGYRHSNLEGLIVLEMELALKKDRPEAVAEKTHAIYEEKKSAQPLWEPSAGCVFKNPAEKTSAGALIDKAGLKGTASGGAVVSEKHANFIVNRGGATASDVLRLIDIIRDRVQKQFNVTLELEVEIW
jgi:UDP-N-acetylmuramate dehydrogenase